MKSHELETKEDKKKEKLFEERRRVLFNWLKMKEV